MQHESTALSAQLGRTFELMALGNRTCFRLEVPMKVSSSILCSVLAAFGGEHVARAQAMPTAAEVPTTTSDSPPSNVSPAAPVSRGPGTILGPDETAGYHNGTFFVRDRSDTFRFYLQGRVHADWLGQFAPGVSSLPAGSGVFNGFYLRRARLEVGGEFFQRWQWQLSGEFSSSTSVDNAAGTQVTPTCAPSAPGSTDLSCNNRENPVDNPNVKAIPTDVYVNYGGSPGANLQVGQFLVPFSFENPLGDNTTPFLERSLAVRNVGVPLLRDLGAMFWGEAPDRAYYYKLAILDGDGPNRVNPDRRYDVAGRVVVRPFMHGESSATPYTKWAHLGLSARAGSRDARTVGYDLPSLTTQGGFAFWKPTYKDSQGSTVHILPSGSLWALAADLYLPLGPFDVTAEFIYARNDTREASDGLQLSSAARLGRLEGYGWYTQVGYWIIGDQSVVGLPNHGRPVHLDPSEPQRPWKAGVQALAKFEQLHLTYRGASRAGAADALTPDGDIDVDAVELGVNYWLTRHLRIGVNYSLYLFPDSAPLTASSAGGPVQSSAQRAIAPGQILGKGLDDGARDTGHTLNELQARLGVQF
jgi:hypothetical protein